MHPPGFSDPRSADFHARSLRSQRWAPMLDATRAEACGRCHEGSPTRPAGVTGAAGDAPSCTSCHEQPGGPLSCGTCHGDGERATPPRDPCLFPGSSPSAGAHEAHLRASPLHASPFTCETCHPSRTTDFTGSHGNGVVDLAFDKNGTLTSALREPPSVAPKFSGQPDDVIAQAEALFRQQRSLTLAQLLDFHSKQGGTRTREDALTALFAAEWNLDGPAWDQLYPKDAYLAGNELWDRHDRAQERAARGDEQARVQMRRLIDAIKPAVFEDLGDIDPRHGYVPVSYTHLTLPTSDLV